MEYCITTRTGSAKKLSLVTGQPMKGVVQERSFYTKFMKQALVSFIDTYHEMITSVRVCLNK